MSDNDIKNKIVSTEKTFYSYHVFLFPFKWKYKKRDDVLIEKQTDLSSFHKWITGSESNWERGKSWYPPQTLVAYNEANFFYDFVRDALYDTDDRNSFLRHYRYKLTKPSFYGISCKGKEYKLEIDDILLHIYNAGVGVLSFHLYNRDQNQSHPNDILYINQFGRRIQPPFYGTDTDKIGTQEFFNDTNWLEGIKQVQQKELASKIWIESNKGPLFIEQFHLRNIPPDLFQLPAHIGGLLPPAILEEVQIRSVLDDRMFVVCWYGNNQLLDSLRANPVLRGIDESGKHLYKKDEWWYKYLFIDADLKTCQNDELTEELLNKHTNARWLNFGTFYGVSRYSLVSLTGTISNMQENNAAFIITHMQSMYYKVAELCLVQRSCVLRFSDEITEISELPEDKNIVNRSESLYKQYIRFLNKIHFREVTAQEQGIELYDLLQKHMRLDRDVAELDKEMHELHEYVVIRGNERRNQFLQYISILGALFVIPTFVAAFFGNSLKGINSIIVLFILCLVIATMSLGILKLSTKWKWTLMVCILIFIALAVYFLGPLMNP